MALLPSARIHTSHPRRRRVLMKSGPGMAGLGRGAVGQLDACSASASWSNASSSTSSGPRTFTDDRGPTKQSNGKADPMAPNLPVEIVAWNSEPRYSYTAIGSIVQRFASVLQNAKKVA
jgi:hypothetical protein